MYNVELLAAIFAKPLSPEPLRVTNLEKLSRAPITRDPSRGAATCGIGVLGRGDAEGDFIVEEENVLVVRAGDDVLAGAEAFDGVYDVGVVAGAFLEGGG